MKQITLILAIIFFTMPIGVSAYSIDGPRCTQDDSWELVVNNAFKIAEEYALSQNPRSTFITALKDYRFIKQVRGDFEGKYLLMITNEHGSDVSTAILLPLFDVNKPSRDLDVNKPLWKIIDAKFNGDSY